MNQVKRPNSGPDAKRRYAAKKLFAQATSSGEMLGCLRDFSRWRERIHDVRSGCRRRYVLAQAASVESSVRSRLNNDEMLERKAMFSEAVGGRRSQRCIRDAHS